MEPYGKLEWHQRDPEMRCRPSVKRMSWSWFSAELLQFWQTELEFRVKGDAAFLALHDSIRAAGETTIDGGSPSTRTDLRGRLTFVPAGSSVQGWNRFKGGVSSVFAVHLVPAKSVRRADDISEIPPSLYFESDNLKATLQKLQSVVNGAGINDHAYAETLGLLLLWELRHAVDPKRSPRSQIRGGLTLRQLRRVQEFVDAQISTEISISDLASVAGLSHYHFIRTFKEAAGHSPYQYVLSERTRHAKGLLLSTPDLSLEDVARAAGFSDTSQLNRVFRKFVGVTPTVFRRESGSRFP